MGISIGISIYNNSNNFKNLINSILATACRKKISFEIIVYDDGSNEAAIIEDIYDFCTRMEIVYLRNQSNLGVSHAWNSITAVAQSNIVAILNDDTRVVSADWMEQILNTFNNNTKVGIVYWGQRVVDYESGKLLYITEDTLEMDKADSLMYRYMFNGAFFAFQKQIWKDILQPDGSIGFWEDLISYCEEVDFTCEFLTRGYKIVQIPVYFDHFKSATFKSNPNLRIRENISNYLKMTDYLNIAINELNWFYKPTTKEKLYYKYSLALFKPQVHKLPYSVALTLKKWNSRIIGKANGKDIVKSLLTNQLELVERTLSNNTN